VADWSVIEFSPFEAAPFSGRRACAIPKTGCYVYMMYLAGVYDLDQNPLGDAGVAQIYWV